MCALMFTCSKRPVLVPHRIYKKILPLCCRHRPWGWTAHLYPYLYQARIKTGESTFPCALFKEVTTRAGVACPHCTDRYHPRILQAANRALQTSWRQVHTTRFFVLLLPPFHVRDGPPNNRRNDIQRLLGAGRCEHAFHTGRLAQARPGVNTARSSKSMDDRAVRHLVYSYSFLLSQTAVALISHDAITGNRNHDLQSVGREDTSYGSPS